MWTMNAGPKTILVALDGSSVAEEALPYALAQARAFSAELVLLRVVPPPVLPVSLTSVAKQEAEEPESEEEQAARAYLEAMADNLRAQGAQVSVRVRRGPIVASIIDEASHVDMLLLANHGAGRLARFLVGNVATQVLPLIPCPTLLIPTAPLKPDPDAPMRSFKDDVERLGSLIQRPLGLRTVALDRIVGSVGRAAELRADFLPRAHPAGDARFRRIKKAMQSGAEMPPVDLYKSGYDYYVLDGHHRLAAARTLGQLETDAVVTEFLPMNNADLQRVFTERRQFEQQTGLTRIGATRPGHYERLLEMIRRYAEHERIGDLKEAAMQWYTHVYLPMAARIRAARLNTSFPGERTADLVVHVEDLRQAEEARLGRPVSWEEALQLMVDRYRNSRRQARIHLPNLRRLLARSSRQAGS
ncbi:MAG TPA: universal stress protein [Chloroflexota bacterium]|jgi:nucleotide-binding universal stress UspA family protein|nr:universal stress protein [Chloroflexota bacterium]